jgi:pyruvate carboxylase
VAFIDNHPELFEITQRFDSATKTLRYIANLTVNGNPDVGTIDTRRTFRKPAVPHFHRMAQFPAGTKNKLDELGPEAFCSWVRKQKNILYTDTTLRDAHQSLLATRVRSLDMLAVAEGFAKANPQVFSLEMWGGATFDVSLRFLRECPWQRLQSLRKAVPNILFQMLFRGLQGLPRQCHREVYRKILGKWHRCFPHI